MDKEHCDLDVINRLISSIGGPSLDASDIGYLNDLEAGRLLLKWISSQAPEHPVTGEGEISGLTGYDNDSDRRIRAAMRASVLEPDEVTILNDERLSEAISRPGGRAECQENYMPPSQLKRNTDFISREANNVQRELRLLRSRISQTKESLSSATRSIKMLQRTLYDTNAKIRHSEERISELSITSDTTIISTIKNSQGLLDDFTTFGLSKEIDHADPAKQLFPADHSPFLEECRGLLLASKSNLADLIAMLEESMAVFGSLEQEKMKTLIHLQSESERIRTALEEKLVGSIANSPSYTGPIDDETSINLSDICSVLEEEATLREQGNAPNGNIFDRFLSELHEGYFTDAQHETIRSSEHRTERILRKAWVMDQFAILQLHTDTLDEALSSMDSALEPLESLYTALARVVHCIQEAEAVLEAFVEELGDIHLANPDIMESVSATVRASDTEMEARIREVLSDWKDPRIVRNSPLLLLTKEDIASELTTLKTQLTRAEASERAWSSDILQNYSSPIHAALLSQIYANAPLNTSTPFAFPANVRDLETRTRARTAELQNAASTVDRAVPETFSNESNIKRLGAFVEKWCED